MDQQLAVTATDTALDLGMRTGGKAQGLQSIINALAHRRIRVDQRAIQIKNNQLNQYSLFLRIRKVVSTLKGGRK